MILSYIILSLVAIFFVINIIAYLWLLRTTYKAKKRAEKYMKDKGLDIINKKIDKFIN